MRVLEDRLWRRTGLLHFPAELDCLSMGLGGKDGLVLSLKWSTIDMGTCRYIIGVHDSPSLACLLGRDAKTFRADNLLCLEVYDNIAHLKTTEADGVTISHSYHSFFGGFLQLQTIILPSCISVGARSFDGLSRLRTVNLDSVRYVGAMAFMGCIRLKSIDLPECRVLYNGAFSGCHALVSVHLPKLMEFRDLSYDRSTISWCKFNRGMFRGCGKLKDLEFPAMTGVRNNGEIMCMPMYPMFEKCHSLHVVRFLNLSVLKLDLRSKSFALNSIRILDMPNCTDFKSLIAYLRKYRDIGTINLIRVSAKAPQKDIDALRDLGSGTMSGVSIPRFKLELVE